MSSAHRQTVEALFDAFARGDMAAMLDCYADDVEYESWPTEGVGVNHAQAAGVPWMPRLTGKAAVAEHVLAPSDLEVASFRIVGYFEGDDKVVVEAVIEATWRPTGISFHDEELHWFELNAAGKIIRTRHYLDTAKHIAAAGLDYPALRP